MTTCDICHRDFLGDMVQPLISSDEKPLKACGVCALERRNDFCGLPPGTPFKGEIAKETYEKTYDYLEDIKMKRIAKRKERR